MIKMSVTNQKCLVEARLELFLSNTARHISQRPEMSLGKSSRNIVYQHSQICHLATRPNTSPSNTTRYVTYMCRIYYCSTLRHEESNPVFSYYAVYYATQGKSSSSLSGCTRQIVTRSKLLFSTTHHLVHNVTESKLSPNISRHLQ